VNTGPIFTAVEQLRQVAGDGPATRGILDALFRHVHNLKATASANGLNDLAAAAHEFENVLHSIRSGAADAPISDAIPADIWNSLKQDQKHTVKQAISEGARLVLVEADFDVADFDREFPKLKESLSKTGEVISTLPRVDNQSPGKVNFRILYAQKGEATANSPKPAIDLQSFERAFEKFSAELINLPAVSSEGVLQQVLRAGRAAALVTGKEVDFEVRGEELLDKRLVEPLIHLVRNAVDHGIESGGKIVIEAAILDNQTKITVSDNGRGIDPSLIDQIFNPGFSTAGKVSEISGRGVGLDAVKTALEEAGGTITVSSKVGHGSTFEIRLPEPSTDYADF
jgi:two-component system chemotaxis sensor kinase CheA